MSVQTNSSDEDMYNFKPSKIGDSWLIGTDRFGREEDNWANAFKSGSSGCPVNLTIPSTLTNKKGETKKVEVIGQFAFYSCSYFEKTRRLKVPKQVKVIKYAALGQLDNLEVFELEEGSILEKIEQWGLDEIGWSSAKWVPRITLVLPSSLTTVERDSIRICDLFDTIIYCGSHPLTEYSNLAMGGFDPKLMVSSRYPPNISLFGYGGVDRDSQEEVEEKCRGYLSGFNTEFTESGEDVIIKWWGNETNKGCPSSLEIPEKADGYKVVAIEDKAFANCDSVGPISLPSSLKRIGAFAFANLSHATSVFSNANELEIGEGAFQGCGKDAEQPINVSLHHNTKFGKNAFAGAKIGEVYIM